MAGSIARKEPAISDYNQSRTNGPVISSPSGLQSHRVDGPLPTTGLVTSCQEGGVSKRGEKLMMSIAARQEVRKYNTMPYPTIMLHASSLQSSRDWSNSPTTESGESLGL